MNPVEFLEDNQGGLSAIRLCLVLWVVFVLGVWMYISISEKRLAAIDNSILTMVGILASAKAVQRYAENPVSLPPTPNGP